LCKECRHWDTAPAYYEKYDDDGEEIEVPEVRLCLSDRVVYGDGDKPTVTEGGAVYTDASGYHASLKTTATFGCVCGEKV
jgi:hypothetical protein